MLNNFIDRIKLSFRKDKELYLSLYEILGFYPHDISYYKMALLHKSIMHRNSKGKPVNNERLEFLGDAVLDAVVGDIVYQHFPGKREGYLTNTRSKLVQRDTLNKLAQEGSFRLELYITYLQGVLEKYESLPELLANDSILVRWMDSAPSKERTAFLNTYLEKINEITHTSDIYLIDPQGTTIAASNWNAPISFVGENFSYRPYFQQAIQGATSAPCSGP